MNLNITDDQVATLLREYLLTSIRDAEGLELEEPLVVAMHRVVAWYSVPGEYMEGLYDGQ